MRIGIIGSNSMLNYDLFERKLSLFSINQKDTIVAGNCFRGSDKLSERYARKHKMELETIPTEWAIHQTTALVRRNIELAEKCDFVLCFWDYRAGEYASIVRFCTQLKVPFSVIFW